MLSGKQEVKITVSVNDNNINGAVGISSDAGKATWQTVPAGNFLLKKGKCVIRIHVTEGGLNLRSLRFILK